METVVKPMPDERRRRARRSAIVLLLVAAAIYAGFIFLSVTGHRT